MFTVDRTPTPYSDPWQSTLTQRQARFFRARRRIVYLYDRPDNSTFRYRVHNMIQAVEYADPGVSAAYFHEGEYARVGDAIDRCDAVVLCRTRYSHTLDWLVNRARRSGKRVFFDVDDLIYDTTYAHLVVDTLAQDVNHPGVWDHWFAYIGRIGASLRLCDEAITTNDYLAGQIRAFTNRPVSVIPNFMNAQQLEVSAQLYEAKERNGFARDGAIHLGYFSGTPSHNKDFRIVSDVIAKMMDEDERIHLLIVGFMEIEGDIQRHRSRITQLPLTDFINLQRHIAGVEINLVPLIENSFTNSKSELKYFEAGAVGTVTIATPIHSYANAIQDGHNGFLAHAADWERCIAAAIATLDRYGSIADRSREQSVSHYSWTRFGQSISKIVLP